MTSFNRLGLADSLTRAVLAEGYDTATPIQQQAIPVVLAGRDLMGCAQTGTGKTAAFALPTLHRLCENRNDARRDAATTAQGAGSQPGKQRDRHSRPDRRPIRSLILAPTRELAAQIGASLATYGRFTGLRHTVVYGGVGQGPQVRALQAGVDLLVATPGRLLDLMDQGYIDLRHVEILILDEADQMLDMGFIVPLRRIVAAVPRARQTLMFSATMPPTIRKLANEWLRDPAHVQIAPVATTVELVDQSVYFVEPRHKPHLLTHFLQTAGVTRTLVFARTKHGADKIVKQLIRSGIRAAAIHGNKSQNVRQRTLEDFKSDRPPVLVATDIAARGLDVEGVSHVINYELPDVPETYVHRIGRTGRAGASGSATSFCAREERDQLRQIERLTRQAIPIEQNQPEYPRETVALAARPVNGGRAAEAKLPRPAASAGHAARAPGRSRRVNGRRRRAARGRSRASTSQ